jgi:hypothetical protein
LSICSLPVFKVILLNFQRVRGAWLHPARLFQPPAEPDMVFTSWPFVVRIQWNWILLAPILLTKRLKCRGIKLKPSSLQ